MTIPPYEYITPGDYLEAEIKADSRHEYFEGRVYAMAGASLNHNFVVSNLSRKINIFLDGENCNLFGSDLRITTPNFDSYLYPDLSIVCNEVEVQDKTFTTVTNPVIIIEVMSPSTRGFDMAFKFHYYKQISSLREYILVDSNKFFIHVHRRGLDHRWEEPIIVEEENASITLVSIGLELLVRDIYRNVSFTENGF